VELAEWLRNRPSPVVVISGLGGLGKSALALMAALRQSWRFRAVVTLSAKDDPVACSPSTLVSALDAVLDLGGTLSSGPTSFLRQQWALTLLNETPVLLVLDNLESLDEIQTRAWTDFLAGLDPRQGSMTLLTLRPAAKHPLTDLAGPAHLRLERLAEPDALRLLTDGLDARALWGKVEPITKLAYSEQQRLTALARQAHLEWVPLSHLAALDDWGERAGCHPYQLRLAVGALAYAHNTWVKVRERLHDLRGRDWEQQAEALVGAMLKDLASSAPGAVKLLQAMLVFRGAASYEALRAVAGQNDEDDVVFDGRLTDALDSNLLEAGGRSAHYDLHPLTRAYLEAHCLPDPATLAEFRYRHAMYFTEWAHRYQNEKESIVGELPNLEAVYAFFSSVTGAFDETLVGFVSSVQPALESSGYWENLIPMLVEAQQACERLADNTRRAKLISNLAQMYTNVSAYESALRWGQEAVNLALQIGEVGALAEAHLRMGWTCLYISKFAKALEHLKQSEILATQAGRLDLLASAFHFTSRVYTEKGDFDQALNYLRFQLRLPPEANSPGAWAFTWLRGAEILLKMGKVRLAKRLLLKSTPQFQGSAYLLRALAQVALAEGNAEEALTLLNQSLRSMGYRRGEMNVRQDIAEAYVQLGYLNEASKLIDEIMQYRTASGERKQLAEACYLKGRVLESLGSIEAALQFYEESLDIFESIECLPPVSGKSRTASDRLKSILSHN